ncbi:MAG: rhodanese-related sulfurtransferase [Sphingobacteriales bacterium]|jgi:rhodanese-related sulfurtransferase
MFSLTTLFGCAQKKVGSGAYNMTLKALLSHSVPEVEVKDISDTSDVFFLDSRAKAEFEVSHIKGAKWVGYDDFDLARVSEVSKDKKIVVYCSVGFRSEKISEKLIADGFTNVSNLYGGIFEWKNQDKPVFVDSIETDSVHAFDKTWGIWLKKGEKVYNK